MTNGKLIGIKARGDNSIETVSDQIYEHLECEIKSFRSKSPILADNHIIHRKIPKFMSELDSSSTIILPSHTYAAGIDKECEADVIALVHGLDAMLYNLCNKISDFNFRKGTEKLHNVDKVISLSQRASKQLTRYRKTRELPEINEKVITQGLNESKFHREDKNPENIDLPENYILYAGSLGPRKNPKLAMDVAKELQKNLVIAGRTQRREDQMRKYAEEIGIKQLINFTGYLSIEDLRRTYSNAGVYLHPSLMEGYGRTPVEAAACGTKPIIHKDLGCEPDLPVAETYNEWKPEKVAKLVRENFGEKVEYQPKTWEEFAEEFRQVLEA